MALSTAIIALLVIISAFIISALPLYFAVKVMGGKTSLFKTIFINLISGLIVGAVKYVFKTWGALIAFIFLIWIYHESFRLKWFKAFFAWILQFVFVAIFYFILLALFGVSLGLALLL